MKLSVVSPVYKAERMVEELVQRILALSIPEISEMELVLVEDGSPDQSWEEIKKVAAKYPQVKGIQLSRNFGQHYAITAGLRNTSGDWVVVMDCDLQDRPEEICNLLNKANQGWDIVFAKRELRQDINFKNWSSKAFHLLYRILSGNKSDHSIANFGIFSAQVIEEFNKLNERSRSFPALVQHLGFKKTSIQVQHASRFEGKSGYSLSKLFKLAFDVIISNSNRPLWLAIGLGLTMSIFSFLLAAYNLMAKYLGLILVDGYTSIIFSIWFVGGLNLFVLGIIGIYLGKIYDESKARPFFIIKETLNIK